MTAHVCAAAYEIDLGTSCGAPSTAKVTVRCAHGHDREGHTCDEHAKQMRRGLTYCYACFIAAHACRVFIVTSEAVTADA